jgi:hypothetical protein
MPAPTLNEPATANLVAWAEEVDRDHDDAFAAAQRWTTRMGAHPTGDGEAEIGIWAPELATHGVAPEEAVLEIVTPPPDLDLSASDQTVTLQRDTVRLRAHGDVLWGVVDGMRPGTRDTVGSFYWVRFPKGNGTWGTVHDHLAHSVPFGAKGPAEFYDVDRMQRERADADYWADLPDALLDGTKNGRPQFGPPQHILQIHPGTASESGTIAGLTRIYREIARKQRAGEPLTPAEQNYAEYDAVQLMPVEPTIVHEAGPPFWSADESYGPEADTATIRLRAPDVINWGYDILISASSAVNPAILETKRPDELADFAAALHDMPRRPMQLVFDVVFGHTDNQAVDVLNDDFLAGPGMYGMNMQFRHPMTRAVMLEMQRRKGNYGADGIRVDGAQDFKYWDADDEQLYYDDDYLQEMSDVVQTTAGTEYYPWMIFEDGRPWPQDDWELSSTYRAVIEDQPDVFQWGPLTFAHNTPFLFTFWISKWWRIREIVDVGSHWISGCANHDTLRRGAQVEPEERINTFLGDSLPEIIENAYDNPATNMLTYGFFPGVPMDFINALMRAPWSFIRNTDDRYGVKVVSEEANFLEWRVTPERFERDAHFPRLKDLGFTDLEGLRRFLHTLDHAVQATDYDLPAIAKLLRAMDPPLDGPDLTVDSLKTIADAWMEDVHDYCNVTHAVERLDETRTSFNRAVRRFRSARPWLMNDLQNDEWLTYREPCDGTILFSGWRRAPDGDEEVLFIGTMEGAPAEVVPVEHVPVDKRDGWSIALASPGIDIDAPDETISLGNSEAILLTR